MQLGLAPVVTNVDVRAAAVLLDAAHPSSAIQIGSRQREPHIFIAWQVAAGPDGFATGLAIEWRQLWDDP